MLGPFTLESEEFEKFEKWVALRCAAAADLY